MPNKLPVKVSSFRGPYEFLSNFHEGHPFLFEGDVWSTSEHAFQAQKTTDLRWRNMIRRALTPREAKKIGRQAPLREDWDEVKDDCMFQVLKAKFSNEELQKKLLNTGNSLLEEGNTWGDQYWGVVNGQGENMLGRLLMVLRDDIRETGCDDHDHSV